MLWFVIVTLSVGPGYLQMLQDFDALSSGSGCAGQVVLQGSSIRGSDFLLADGSDDELHHDTT
jgi:hypothetical protein